MLAWMYSPKLRYSRVAAGFVALALMAIAGCGVDNIHHAPPLDAPQGDAPQSDATLGTRPTFEASYKQGCTSNAQCANELTCINNVCDCCQTFGDDALGPFACDVIAPEAFVQEICLTRPVAVTGPAAASYLGGACESAEGYHQNCPPQLVCIRDNFADQCFCCDDTGDSLTCSTSEAFASAHCLNP